MPEMEMFEHQFKDEESQSFFDKCSQKNQKVACYIPSAKADVQEEGRINFVKWIAENKDWCHFIRIVKKEHNEDVTELNKISNVHAFSRRLEFKSFLNRCDLVVSRGGAAAVSEALALNKLPMILPQKGAGDQISNGEKVDEIISRVSKALPKAKGFCGIPSPGDGAGCTDPTNKAYIGSIAQSWWDFARYAMLTGLKEETNSWGRQKALVAKHLKNILYLSKPTPGAYQAIWEEENNEPVPISGLTTELSGSIEQLRKSLENKRITVEQIRDGKIKKMKHILMDSIAEVLKKAEEHQLSEYSGVPGLNGVADVVASQVLQTEPKHDMNNGQGTTTFDG
jgi:hypothetical protein